MPFRSYRTAKEAGSLLCSQLGKTKWKVIVPFPFALLQWNGLALQPFPSQCSNGRKYSADQTCGWTSHLYCIQTRKTLNHKRTAQQLSPCVKFSIQVACAFQVWGEVHCKHT